MKKRVFVIAAIVSGALAVSGCTTNPYTGEREAGKSSIGAGIGSLVGAGIGALSSSKKDRGKGALIGAAAGAAVGGGVGYYMDVQEAKLRDKMQGTTGVSVTRSGDNIILNMPNNVTFDSNSSNLKPAGANTLTGVAMVLKEYNKNRRQRARLHRQHRQSGSEYAPVAAARGLRGQRLNHSRRRR
ncbi:putative outer membrane lipoprotein [Citrobacter braakii]|nr:putative outer membrane lipoprotein [Citrobacter braakii]